MMLLVAEPKYLFSNLVLIFHDSWTFSEGKDFGMDND